MDDLGFALELADRADTITMERFGALDLRVDTKPDLTPVTDADRSAETTLRDLLARDRPDDTIVGEEFGGTAGLGRQWVIDPIDGTKNFVRGVPVWCTLIALLEDGVPTVGVVSAPALGRRWWAGPGQGAHTSFMGATRRLSVSGVSELGAASLSYSDLTTGWDDRRDRFLAADRRRVAGPRLRRLLVLLPGRRGRRGHRGRTRSEALGHRAAGHPDQGGRRHIQRHRRPVPARTAEARWPPTDSCTTRWSAA